MSAYWRTRHLTGGEAMRIGSLGIVWRTHGPPESCPVLIPLNDFSMSITQFSPAWTLPAESVKCHRFRYGSD
jgi:hypothetical protein